MSSYLQSSGGKAVACCVREQLIYGNLALENPTSIDLATHQRADDVLDVSHLFHALTLQAWDTQRMFVRLALGF